MTAPVSLLEIVRRAVMDLEAVHGKTALVGGLAVGVHVLERATRDADFVAAVAGDAEAEQITADLVARGYVLTLALQRGFARGKQLAAELEAQIARWR